ncbi:MAG: DUF4783 domain-containing protein [Cyclobacteriaceae bacterium]
MRYKLFIILLFVSTICLGQSTTDNVAIALKTGSSKELIKYFNTVTELKVEDKGANYSKVQAESIIRDFFTKYPAQNFTYIHKGSSPEGLKYNIGRYSFDQGSFRVVMLLKQVQNRYVIDTISFNKE